MITLPYESQLYGPFSAALKFHSFWYSRAKLSGVAFNISTCHRVPDAEFTVVKVGSLSLEVIPA